MSAKWGTTVRDGISTFVSMEPMDISNETSVHFPVMLAATKSGIYDENIGAICSRVCDNIYSCRACIGDIYSSECVTQTPCGNGFSKCYRNKFSRIFKSWVLQCLCEKFPLICVSVRLWAHRCQSSLKNILAPCLSFIYLYPCFDFFRVEV